MCYLGGTSDNSEFAAIKTIHKQLDDNADGSVDFSESEEVCLYFEAIISKNKLSVCVVCAD